MEVLTTSCIHYFDSHAPPPSRLRQQASWWANAAFNVSPASQESKHMPFASLQQYFSIREEGKRREEKEECGLVASSLPARFTAHECLCPNEGLVPGEALVTSALSSNKCCFACLQTLGHLTSTGRMSGVAKINARCDKPIGDYPLSRRPGQLTKGPELS